MTKEAEQAQPRKLRSKLFSNKLEDTPSGGLIIHDVLALGEGQWHASNMPMPIYYSAAELEKSASKWSNTSMYDGHEHAAATKKVGNILNPRFDPEQKGVVVDVYYHGHNRASKDLIEMSKAGVAGEMDPLWVSVEHISRDVYNSELKRYEATAIEYLGIATVDAGACEKCRLNGENTDNNSSEGMDLETKELTEKYEAQAKELEVAKKEITELKAVKTVPVADFEAVQKMNKELAEAKDAITKELSDVKARIEKLEKAPAAAKTNVNTDNEPELIMLG